jgi:branched-chain amino acid transport system ATP-binding protein
MKILELHSINKSYVRNIINKRGEEINERFNILKDINLFIKKEKITTLIGGNGAGKTTLLNIISGFTIPDRGNIYFYKDNKQVSLIGKSPDKITNLGIGRLFQDNHIFLGMSVLENMLIADYDKFGEIPFISIFKHKKVSIKEKERIEKARNIFITLFGENNPFWKLKDIKAASLSYGQQRLLGMARLLMGKYELILLDEPTAGVNPAIIDNITQVINFMVEKQNISIILIEHNMKFVEQISDYCFFLSHGNITVQGTPEEVLGNSEVKMKYLGL